jgi:hypothetical protein
MQYKGYPGRRVGSHVQCLKNKLMLRVGVTPVIRFRKQAADISENSEKSYSTAECHCPETHNLLFIMMIFI